MRSLPPRERPGLGGRTERGLPKWLAAVALAVPTLATALVAARAPHWCFVPIWACGVFTTWQATREIWTSGTLLRSASAVWATLVHLMFLAPLLHLELGFWMRAVELPDDMRPWMGYLAIATSIGLLLMLAAQRLVGRRASRRLVRREIDRRRFLLAGALGGGVAAAAAAHVYRSFGGVAGFVAAFERGLESFVGWGAPIILAGMLPTIVAAIVLGLFRERLRRGWLGLPLLFAFFAAQVTFAGLNGSRSNALLAVLWATIVWHRTVRRVGWTKLLLIGVVCFAFLYVAGFYKAGGRQAVREALAPATAQQTVDQTDRSVPMLVLLDLGRYDVQSLLLERYHGPGRWDLGRGRSYVAGLLSPIPRAIFPGKPDLKVREGTNALIGPGSFERGHPPVSNQYGLAGEAVLNFGPLAIPVAYALFGLLLGAITRLEDALDGRDPRWLLLAFAPVLMARALMVDSDNLVLLLLQSYLVLGPVVWLGSRPAGGDGAASRGEHSERTT